MTESAHRSCIINLDSCVKVSHDYPKNYFKAVITSPPYKKIDGYTDDLIKELVKALYEVTQPKGLAFINFASLAESWGRPFDVYDFFIEAGFKPVTTIIWVKSMVFPSLEDLPGTLGSDVRAIRDFLESLIIQEELAPSAVEHKVMSRYIKTLDKLLEPRQVGHFTPIDDERRMNNLFEYIHVFAKDELPPLDRWSEPLGVPYADPSNLTRGNRGKRGNVHCGGNVWFIPYQTRKGPKTAHPHEYPLELVERCLTLAQAKPGDTVLEPFCGGGSTLIGCLKNDISVVGYEIDPDTLKEAQGRIQNEFKEITFSAAS